MSNRKIILYPKAAMKPIILTDISNDDFEDIQQSILNALNSDKISIINTTNDSLIIRPSEIQAVLITRSDADKDESSKKSEYAAKLRDKDVSDPK